MRFLRDTDRVFNHYNRVRANLSTMEGPEDEDTDWPDTQVDDGMSWR